MPKLFARLIGKLSLPGRRAIPPPPQDLLDFIGSNPDNYKVIGQEFFGYFRELCELLPKDRVLDVGCGIGRMAMPLTGYLRRGSYEGFDVWPEGIDWCQKHITQRYRNFRFHLADLNNSHYRPQNGANPAAFKFPYPDNSFTFAFLASVFTHLLPDAVENYMRELHRVLKPGGRCLITYFLINDESRHCLEEGRSTIPFKLSDSFYHLYDPSVPEMIVAYDENHIKEIHAKALLPVHLIRYGSWCGRTTYLSYQEVVIARKTVD